MTVFITGNTDLPSAEAGFKTRCWLPWNTETHALHPKDFRTNIWRLEAQLLLDTQKQEKAPGTSSNLMA